MSELLFEGLPTLEVTQGILIDLCDRLSMSTHMIQVTTAAGIALQEMMGVPPEPYPADPLAA